MTLVHEIRRSVTDTTPVYAVVGAADLAVEAVRGARARVEHVGALAGQARADLAPRQLTAAAARVPTVAVTLTLEAAGRAEETYDQLADRGRRLVERIRKQRATQDLLAQGKTAVSRGKAAATTVRHAATDTRTAAKSTLTVAEREAADVATDVRTSVRTRTEGTKRAAKRTATTATTRAARAKSTTKAATTSARKTAAAAAKAANAAATKVGD
jgi:hypothetical protein